MFYACNLNKTFGCKLESVEVQMWCLKYSRKLRNWTKVVLNTRLLTQNIKFRQKSLYAHDYWHNIERWDQKGDKHTTFDTSLKV